MRHSHVKTLNAILAAAALVMTGTSALWAAQDHNSSRSNKSGSAAIDTGMSDATPVRAKVSTSMSGKTSEGGGGGGGAAGVAVSEEGVTDNLSKDEDAPTTKKTFVVPHVLEKSGRISSEPEDPAASGGGEPSGMAINQKGLPGEKKPAKKSATK
jgi:hypothetical protein